MACDPYWNSVVLAMHMDDVGLTDLKGHVVTLVGNVVRSSTQSKFGGYSAKFDGAGDYLSLSYSSDFDIGNVFTIEGWANATAFPSTDGTSARLVSRWDFLNSKRAYYVQITRASGVIKLDASVSPDGSSLNAVVVSAPITGVSTGQWFHFAVVHTGASLLAFINGTLGGTVSTTINPFNTDSTLLVGSMQGDTANYFNGYIDDIRITKGFARYTENFTVPTEAFPNTASQLTGTVLNSASAPVARVVRSHRRSDGVIGGTITSSAVDGSFSVSAYDGSPHYVVCLDDDLNENALILDNITPV